MNCCEALLAVIRDKSLSLRYPVHRNGPQLTILMR